MRLKPLDQNVVLGQYGGNQVKLDGETYLIVKAEEILAVVE